MKTNLAIGGMHCSSCSKLIESELKDKVKSISVNQATNIAKIEFDENSISLGEIKEIIKNLGYKA